VRGIEAGMTIHLFGPPGEARGRNLFDLLARSPERDPAVGVSAHYGGDRRGPRVSFTVRGGEPRERSGRPGRPEEQ